MTRPSILAVNGRLQRVEWLLTVLLIVAGGVTTWLAGCLTYRLSR